MKLIELRLLLETVPETYDEWDVKVWLPGSRVRLTGQPIINRKEQAVLIEGNLDPGSALGSR